MRHSCRDLHTDEGGPKYRTCQPPWGFMLAILASSHATRAIHDHTAEPDEARRNRNHAWAAVLIIAFIVWIGAPRLERCLIDRAGDCRPRCVRNTSDLPRPLSPRRASAGSSCHRCRRIPPPAGTANLKATAPAGGMAPSGPNTSRRHPACSQPSDSATPISVPSSPSIALGSGSACSTATSCAFHGQDAARTSRRATRRAVPRVAVHVRADTIRSTVMDLPWRPDAHTSALRPAFLRRISTSTPAARAVPYPGARTTDGSHHRGYKVCFQFLMDWSTWDWSRFAAPVPGRSSA